MLPAFVDVWYTGFGGQPAGDRYGSNRGWNHRIQIAQGTGQLQVTDRAFPAPDETVRVGAAVACGPFP